MENKQLKQWEEKENTKQKKKEEKPKTNNKWFITGETETKLIKRTKNDTGKIKKKRKRKIEDLTDRKFGKWTVIKFAEKNDNGIWWECKCNCGTIRKILSNSLKYGHSKSCGCGRRGYRLDLTGQKFGRLTVIKYFGKDKYKCNMWECLCECGNSKIVRGTVLVNERSKSCGCFNKERTTETHRKEKGESGFHMVLSSYKNNAKKRNITFNLTIKEFKKLTKGNCFYCNTKPSNVSCIISRMTKKGIEWSKYVYNGIDRIDNSKGYTVNNCVSCCGQCNYAKKDMDIIQFKEWIKKMYKHMFVNNNI